MRKIGDNWTCPYCRHAQVIAKERHRFDWHQFYISGWVAGTPLGLEVTACANGDCSKLTFSVELATWKRRGDNTVIDKRIADWRLLPTSVAKETLKK